MKLMFIGVIAEYVIPLLLFYFIPFIVCVLFAKHTEEEEYLTCAYIPIINLVTMFVGAFLISYDILFQWIRK